MAELANQRRPGFTLVEVLVVIVIIALLMAALTTGMSVAQESARRARTQQTINRIHNQVIPRWESYQLRRLPVDVVNPSTVMTASRGSAQYPPYVRLGAVRELMRMELPDSYNDVDPSQFTPSFLLFQGTQPWYSPLVGSGGNIGPYQALYKKAGTNAATLFPGAECLYMIMTAGNPDKDASGQGFSQADVGDYDNDGQSEIWDGWRNPIEFIRWPAGFASDLQPQYSITSTDPRYAGGLPPDIYNTGNYLTYDPVGSHDAFDVLMVDVWQPPSGPGKERAYNLFPLIMSGGPSYQPILINTGLDEGFGILFDTSGGASNPFGGTRSDPYTIFASQTTINATPARRASPLSTSAGDNLHNQNLGSR
jgi:prepilin-type N-terminal cleavage/methylation domain-containing protein